MNASKVQNEINSIITEVRAKGWKMTKATQKALRELDDLGLTEFVPAHRLGDAEIVNAIIDAAKDAGGKRQTRSGWTTYGDGYADTTTTEPSALYLALNEEDEVDDDYETETHTTSDGTEVKATITKLDDNYQIDIQTQGNGLTGSPDGWTDYADTAAQAKGIADAMLEDYLDADRDQAEDRANIVNYLDVDKDGPIP